MAIHRDLDQLRRIIAAIANGQAGIACSPLPLLTGAAAIDAHLGQASLTAAGVHEIAGADLDEEQGAASAAFLALCLRHSTSDSPILWVASRTDLYPPGLAGLGLDPRRLVILKIDRDSQAGWAMEEALRCAGLSAVVGEASQADMIMSRRLQLAAEKSQVPCFILRRWPSGERARQWRAHPLAAASRWRIRPIPLDGQASADQGLAAARWRVDLWRCRNGRPASWIVEVGYDSKLPPTVSAIPVDLADALGDGLPPPAQAPNRISRLAFS